MTDQDRCGLLVLLHNIEEIVSDWPSALLASSYEIVILGTSLPRDVLLIDFDSLGRSTTAGIAFEDYKNALILTPTTDIVQKFKKLWP